MIEKNLRICFPDRDEHWYRSTLRSFYANLGDIILESIQSFSLKSRPARQRIKAINPEVLEDLYREGRSVILTGGHYVNWEAMTLMGNRIPHEVFALYKPLKNKFMNEKVQRSRGRFGTSMISVKDYRRYFIDLNSKPKIFIFGIDQSPRKGKGLWMDFLGRQTLVFTGPERLAKEFNVSIVIGRMKRVERGRYELKYELLTNEPRNTEENFITSATNRDIEEQVKEDPSGWLWSHNRWKHSKEEEDGN